MQSNMDKQHPSDMNNQQAGDMDKQQLVDHYDAVIFDDVFEEYFDGSGFANFGYWDETTAAPAEAGANLVDKLVAMIPDRSGNILDVACGKGATTRRLTRSWPADRVTGINISQKQIETCRKNVPGCTFAVMDATRLDFADASLDNAICVEAAFHFDTRERFLREVRRVLKPGGRLVLSDILMTRETERRRPFRTEQNYLPDPAAYEALARDAGFQNVYIEDATEPCWRRYYHRVVTFLHDKFLTGDIDLDGLRRLLTPTYARVGDLTYYLLACLENQ